MRYTKEYLTTKHLVETYHEVGKETKKILEMLYPALKQEVKLTGYNSVNYQFSKKDYTYEFFYTAPGKSAIKESFKVKHTNVRKDYGQVYVRVKYIPARFLEGIGYFKATTTDK